MPPGLWGMRYLVMAREDLSNFVEGRALRTKSVERICRFVLEDIVCRYGSVGILHADREDMNAEEARTFFRRYGVDLKLTNAMNPEGEVETGRPKNKSWFDKTRRLRPKHIKVGDWVLVYDSSLENQHSTMRKFSKRWFGPYMVLGVNDNVTYLLRELNGTLGKRVKLCKRRDNTSELFDFLDLEHRPVEDDYTKEENVEEEEEED
ncbi:hypothetical protein R1sor_004530 [Riccia sorocarpa]|uniref:Integrase catalytic domain-containing protein n=1 Tax=Riccia sorocarpa TaxID=122646 RepID=A0ABD3HKY8_9MARC